MACRVDQHHAGSAMQPVPGKHGHHIPVEIHDNGEAPTEVEENEDPPQEDAKMDEEEF